MTYMKVPLPTVANIDDPIMEATFGSIWLAHEVIGCACTEDAKVDALLHAIVSRSLSKTFDVCLQSHETMAAICTRRFGHAGDHIMVDEDMYVVAQWDSHGQEVSL
jgi:hypothetical protein